MDPLLIIDNKLLYNLWEIFTNAYYYKIYIKGNWRNTWSANLTESDMATNVQDQILLLQKYVSECEESHAKGNFCDNNIHNGRDHCASLECFSNPNMMDSFLVKSSRSSSPCQCELASSPSSSPISSHKVPRNKTIWSKKFSGSKCIRDNDGEISVYTHQLVAALNSGKPIWL